MAEGVGFERVGLALLSPLPSWCVLSGALLSACRALAPPAFFRGPLRFAFVSQWAQGPTALNQYRASLAHQEATPTPAAKAYRTHPRSHYR